MNLEARSEGPRNLDWPTARFTVACLWLAQVIYFLAILWISSDPHDATRSLSIISTLLMSIASGLIRARLTYRIAWATICLLPLITASTFYRPLALLNVVFILVVVTILHFLIPRSR